MLWMGRRRIEVGIAPHADQLLIGLDDLRQT